MPAGWADMTPEQRAAKRTERKTARTARRTERRTAMKAKAAELQGKFDARLAGAQGPWADLIRELAPLIRTGLEQMKPGGATFDANPFFESFYSKVPAQYQAQVRGAVGDLPARINTIAGKLENGAQIQPIAQQLTAGTPMNPPGSTPAGDTSELAAMIRQYMTQMQNRGAGTPRPGMGSLRRRLPQM